MRNEAHNRRRYVKRERSAALFFCPVFSPGTGIGLIPQRPGIPLPRSSFRPTPAKRPFTKSVFSCRIETTKHERR